MKELQLSMNHTQKVRVDKALEKIQSSSAAAASITVASDTIPVDAEGSVIKGLGTCIVDGKVVANVCGVVERIDELVMVRGFKARYKPEIGDVVVGRVIEIAPKSWRVEILSSQDAVLMLSSMDGIQRRRTVVDELNMRSTFEENDVICAEVRGTQQHYGSLHLQVRSEKYGKVEQGQLLTVPPYLVKKRKQHFHNLEQYGIDLILECNGFIWVGKHVEVRDPDQQASKIHNTYTPLEIRRMICRIANAVRVLACLRFTLTLELTMDTVEMSMSQNVDIHEMLGAEFCVRVAERKAKTGTSMW